MTLCKINVSKKTSFAHDYCFYLQHKQHQLFGDRGSIVFAQLLLLNRVNNDDLMAKSNTIRHYSYRLKKLESANLVLKQTIALYQCWYELQVGKSDTK